MAMIVIPKKSVHLVHLYTILKLFLLNSIFSLSNAVCFPRRFCSYRSSHQRCFVKKGVLNKFTKFKRKHLCQSLFLNKVAGPRPATLSKKRLQHRCFPVTSAKFLRTSFLQNTSGPLLLFIKGGNNPCFTLSNSVASLGKI